MASGIRGARRVIVTWPPHGSVGATAGLRSDEHTDPHQTLEESQSGENAHQADAKIEGEGQGRGGARRTALSQPCGQHERGEGAEGRRKEVAFEMTGGAAGRRRALRPAHVLDGSRKSSTARK